MTTYYSGFYPIESADGEKGSAAFLGAISTAIIYLYKRSSTVLTTLDRPNGNVIYTFSTGNTNIVSVTNGWTATMPSGTDPLYVVAATATNTSATDEITPGEWSTPIVLAKNGLDGVNSATVFLFQRSNSSTLPTRPNSNTTYTFSSGILTGTLGSWTQTAPDSANGRYLFVTTATAISSSATDTIASNTDLTSTEWAPVRILSENGISGYTAYLTNESHTVTADNDGTVPAASYSGATGAFRVYLDKVGDISSFFNISTTLVSNPQNLTVTITNSTTDADTYAVTGGFDAGENTASITMRAEGTGTYLGVSIDKTFSLSKSKGGASAKVISVTTDRQIITYAAGGTLSPLAQTTKLSVSKQNTTNAVTWTIKNSEGTSVTPVSSYLFTNADGTGGTNTGDTVYLPADKFNSARGTTNGLTIQASVTDGITLTDQVSIMKVESGSQGTSPLIYSIEPSSPVLVKDASSASADGPYSSITIQGKKYDGNTTTNFGYVTVTINGGTEAGTATNTGTTAYPLAPASTSGASYYTVKLYDTATKTTLLDTQTIYVVYKGTGAIVAALSNDTFVFSAASDGSVPVASYIGSGTEIRVYEGATELTYDGTGTSNGRWKIGTPVVSNITVGTLTDSGTYLTVGQHSGVATGTDTSLITYTITGTSSSGQAFTITKTQSFSKSKTGAGTAGNDAVIATLTNEAMSIFAYADGNVPSTSLTTATGNFKIYKGSTDVTASCTGFNASPSGCTGTMNSSGVYSVTAMTADTATLTLSATYAGTPYTRIFTLTKAKTGYEIVTSIPTTNLFAGRIVYLKADQVSPAYVGKKLYYYNGTGWIAKSGSASSVNMVVDTVDAGSITSAQLASTQIDAMFATIGTLRSAAVGSSRVEISDAVIKVYEGSTLRVKLGNLA